MQLLNFSPANCKNCYKCVRNCEVKAIKIINDQATINEEACIACGKCFVICPQNARNIVSDCDKVQSAKNNHRKMIVSLAPSYIGAYKEPEKFIAGLRQLGFEFISETAIGAEVISQEIINYIGMNPQHKNYITSCCPSVNLLIQRYYPELLPQLLPIVSPMVAHSKMLREAHGSKAFITFIGPCIAKHCESNSFSHKGTVDAVLSFEEIDEILNENGIHIDTLNPSVVDEQACRLGKQYPLEGGIIGGINDALKKSSLMTLSPSGIASCKSIFDSIAQNKLEHVFIEANACQNGCINGPAISKNISVSHLRTYEVKKTLSSLEKETITRNSQSDKKLRQVFYPNQYMINIAPEEEIKKILMSMGKNYKSDELNCGACGYNTCQEKAQAVYNGMSEPEMCMPNMRNKAERLSNLIFEHTPNIVFLVDENYKIIDANPATEKAFKTSLQNIKHKDISQFIKTNDLDEVLKSQKNIYGKKIILEKFGLTISETILYLQNHHIMLVIFADITDLKKQEEELLVLKENTLNAATEVINKQMRVAQEVASLLGETTAETKITLLKLQKIISGEEGEKR